MTTDPIKRRRRPRAVFFARGKTGGEVISSFQDNSFDLTAGSQQLRFHAFGLSHEVGKIRAAMGDEERRRTRADVHNRARKLLLAGIRGAQKTRSYRQSGIGSKIINS